jgi:hypothetical protein
MPESLLRIRNHHSPACGVPPTVNGDDPALYIGYFENPHGEQWVFTNTGYRARRNSAVATPAGTRLTRCKTVA